MSDWTFTKDGWDPSPMDADEAIPAGSLVIAMMTGHGDVRTRRCSENLECGQRR